MITFVVPGKPQGKGRARAFVRAGHVGHYTPEKTRSYEGLIRALALQEMQGKKPTERPVRAEIYVAFGVPDSWPAWKRMAAISGEISATVKPDADNVVKAVKDALNGICWIDDSQVISLAVHKHFSSDPGVTVVINELRSKPSKIKSKGDLVAPITGGSWDETRADMIGLNGNDGLHYSEVSE